MEKDLSLGGLFSNFVKFSSRNKRLLLAFVSIEIISVVVFQNFKTPYYTNKALCTSGISLYDKKDSELASQRTAIDLINHLQLSVDASDYRSLAISLGIDEDVIKEIRGISAKQLSSAETSELINFRLALVNFNFNKCNCKKKNSSNFNLFCALINVFVSLGKCKSNKESCLLGRFNFETS